MQARRAVGIIGPNGDIVPVDPDRIGQPPSVSVVVPLAADDEGLHDCLMSLAGQTLARSAFEVIVSSYGRSPDGSTPATASDDWRAALRLRHLDVGGADRRSAVGAGIAAARGRHVTVVDADTWVTPTYLNGLLAAAQERVLPIALSAVAAGGPGAADEPDLDLPVSLELRPHLGGRVAPRLVPRALDSFEGVLVPTELARSTLRSGPLLGPAGFWIAVLGREARDFHVVGPDDGLRLRRVRPPVEPAPAEWSEVEVLLDELAVIHACVDGAKGAGARAVARARADGIADLLNGYLHRHPRDHGRLRSTARERGLTMLSWPRVNAGLARDLAVLYCFTPYVDTNAIVNARTLYERGLVTDVVTQNLYHRLPRDFLSERIAVEVIDRCVPLDGPADAVKWSVIRDFTARVLTAVDDLEAAKGPYRSLFSSAMQMPSHFAAAAVKLRRPDLHWTAEFLEPLRRNPDGVDRVSGVEEDWLFRELREGMATAGHGQHQGPLAAFEWAELVPYALADELHFTSENQLEHMLAYCRDPSLIRRVRRLAEVRQPSVPSPELYRLRTADYELETDVLNIGYFGAFYGRRGLDEVMAALRLLGPEERHRVRLHVFTKPYERMSIEVLRAGMADVVRVAPYIDYLAFLNLTTEFDVLLVNDLSTADLPTTNPYLPSKIFDYQGSGSSIWAIQEEGSALSTLPADFTSRLGDVDGALVQLRRMLQAADAAGGGRGSSARAWLTE